MYTNEFEMFFNGNSSLICVCCLLVAKIQGADGVVKTNAAVNRPSFQSRLGLARVLSRDANADLAEVKKYYTAAIDMAPNVRRQII